MTNLDGHLSKDNEILYLIKLAGNETKKLEEKDLSKILLIMEEKDYLLTPIIEALQGLSTPYLKYVLSDFKMYGIISENNLLTPEGLDYYAKKESLLTSIFKETATKELKKYFKNKK